jgi:hypothetical protein
MFLVRADTLRGQVGGGWALEMEIFLGPLKWHRADKQVPFGAQKTRTANCRVHKRTLRHIKLFAYPNLLRRPKTDITFAGYFQDEEFLRCLLRVFSFYAFSDHIKYTKYVQISI